MSLRDEIVPYIDGNGLVAPRKVDTNTLSGSDNGPMFYSEYYIMMKKLGLLDKYDWIIYQNTIAKCIAYGLLHRVPIGQEDGQEGPDDYYGVLNACKQLNITDIPRQFLKALIRYKGALNNVSPGVWTGQSFLIRQPQLLAAMIAAAFPSWTNLLHIIIRILAFPVFLMAAVSIFVSCIDVPANQADPRRLSWHLIQTVIPVSIMCRFASLFWYHRLYNMYGVAGMKGVAAQYYEPGHPFIKYWVS